MSDLYARELKNQMNNDAAFSVLMQKLNTFGDKYRAATWLLDQIRGMFGRNTPRTLNYTSCLNIVEWYTGQSVNQPMQNPYIVGV